MDVKCRYSGLRPNAVCMVATVRALKMHSGRFKVVAGKPLDKGIIEENIEALEQGMPNLVKQIENVRAFGIPVVVALNRFGSDTDGELDLIRKHAIAAGADDAVVCDVHARGGAGGADLARAVVRAADKPSNFSFLYELDQPVKSKIETIARKMFGATGIHCTAAANKQIAWIEENGFGKLPVCIAKTHLSLSHDPALKGRPAGFTVPVRDVKVSAGAGIVYALTGEISTMPGLPSVPGGTRVDIDEQGRVVGLF